MKGRIVGSGKKTKYFLDGREVTKRQFDKAFPDKPIGNFGGHLPACWPLVADMALGVHPDQRQEAIEDAEKKGVPTHFDEGGDPHFTSKGHYERYQKAYGFHQKNG